MAVRRPRAIAAQMLVWHLAVVLLVVALGVGLAWYDARRDAYDVARDRALEVSRTVASAPDVTRALGDADPSKTLQPYAERVRHATGTDFVVVMSTNGVRYSHPDPSQLGGHFRGSTGPALRGGEVTETYSGTLGPSVRAVVPVRSGDRVVALVSVGITLQQVNHKVWEALPAVLLVAAGLGALGLVGAWLVGRRLRRQTHGLGEVEITRMYEYYDAVLRAVREGLVLLGHDDRVTLANDEARRLLDLPESYDGKTLAELGLVTPDTGPELHDLPVVVGDRVLLVNRAPARWNDRVVGSVVTLRDRTELQEVTAELDTVRGMAAALRAQNHEAANRLHTMVSLVEMGETEEAVAFATDELDLARRLTDDVVGAVQEPVLSALLLGKSSQAQERGVALVVDPDSSVTHTSLSAHDLVTVVGNLLDNAIDAAQGTAEAVVQVLVKSEDDGLMVAVDDSGPGIAPEHRDQIFEPGWTSKPDTQARGRGVGLALVGQVVRRHEGSTEVGRSTLGGARLTVRVPARRTP
ncbi:sensor histidine kinase [Luteipulveratus mongoliensis]|uniref:histidine kinase n=1 Tax=Luteipulveratus mongoliensis TaxID=571913 RepID=A0A0K1JK35_9MICO|nr:sensor histidine kinase [Luteipulveratus mongoliensis]AKU16935.1 hypothetical protein VV02_15515 [Luteipulveratus mongoliensis]